MECVNYIVIGLYIQSQYYRYITLYNEVKKHH
jgi:hypothetical protein